ncbi:MAG: class I SAM-dependent methyltransferase [Eubacteriales bacterium]
MLTRKYIGKFNAVTLSHQLMREQIRPGQTVVDATCGNGHDTAFLAKEVTATGQVWAFDIQNAACDITKERIKNLGFHHVKVIHDGHENVGEYLSRTIDGAVFNLGYLPSSNSQVITTPKTTKKAICTLLDGLNPSGFICITAYVSHPGGRREYRALKRMFGRKSLHQCQITVFDEARRKNSAPKVLFIQKQVDF